MIKSGTAAGDAVGNWHVFDAELGTNIITVTDTNAIINYPIVSFTSTGFSLNDGPSLNESGKTFLYLAIA